MTIHFSHFSKALIKCIFRKRWRAIIHTKVSKPSIPQKKLKSQEIFLMYKERFLLCRPDIFAQWLKINQNVSFEFSCPKNKQTFKVIFQNSILTFFGDFVIIFSFSGNVVKWDFLGQFSPTVFISSFLRLWDISIYHLTRLFLWLL